MKQIWLNKGDDHDARVEGEVESVINDMQRKD